MSFAILIMLLFASHSVLSNYEVYNFVNEFLKLEDTPNIGIVSFLKFNSGAEVLVSKLFSAGGISFASAKSLPDKHIDENTVFLADLTDSDTRRILREAESRGLLKSPAKWIIFHDNDNLENNPEKDEASDEVEHLNDTVKFSVEILTAGIEIQVYSEVMIVVKEGETYSAEMVYRLRPHMRLVWEPYGAWSPTRNFTDLRTNRVLSLRRQNLQKIVITICTVVTNNDSVNHLADYVDKDIDAMAKVNYYLAEHMIEFVNGSSRRNIANSWGYRRADGSYDGLVHQLSTGVADIGSPLIVSAERMAWVEYVGVSSPMKTGFVFRKPPLSTVANLFLLPFSSGVWLGTLLLALLVAACTMSAWMWENYQVNPQENDRIFRRVTDALMDSMCLVSQQGTWKEPKSASGRTILFLSLLAFMFLFTAYSAYIVALLQSSTNNINTLKDLLDSPLQLVVQDTLYNRYFFSTETDPVRKAIWEKKLVPRGENKVFISPEKGVQLMRQGLYAFHSERLTAYDIIQRTFLEEEKCQLQVIEFLRITYPYMCIAKDSPFKELLKIGMKRLLESGVQARSNARVLTRMPRCAGGGGSFVSVKLRDCAPALQCLACGCGLALLALLAERKHHGCRSTKVSEEDLSATLTEEDVTDME